MRVGGAARAAWGRVRRARPTAGRWGAAAALIGAVALATSGSAATLGRSSARTASSRPRAAMARPTTTVSGPAGAADGSTYWPSPDAGYTGLPSDPDPAGPAALADPGPPVSAVVPTPRALAPPAAPRRAAPGADAGAVRAPSGTAPPRPQPRPEPNRAAPGGPVAAQAPGSVWRGDFPDPSVLLAGSFYYAYSTQVGLDAVPIIRSIDLVHWQSVGDALPKLPAWSNGLDVWAPAVVRGATGYVMFYTTRDAKTGDQCISRAVSPLPQGPFLDASAGPFMCQLDQGGSIDPDPFVDAGGAQWLVWKSQGTLSGQPARIWSQPVTGDWTMLSGSPRSILTTDQRWEGSVVEAPAMVRQGGAYYLLYSGNDWYRASYAIGYAVCRSVAGPCVKPHNGPVLANHAEEAGPGSAGLFVDVFGQLRVAYHAWSPGKVGYPGGARSLYIGSVTISGNRLSIQG